jgi:hypothetical protein
MSSFEEWWNEYGELVASTSKKLKDFGEVCFRAGQAEMRERAAELAGGDVGYEIADLPLEGDDE